MEICDEKENGYREIRDRLMVRYAEIRERLGRVSGDLRHAESPLDKLMDEQSIELENDEVLDALDDSIRGEMTRIERTLVRLDRGEYGVCEVCGELIAMRRLEAQPFTTRCVDCEEQAERQATAE